MPAVLKELYSAGVKAYEFSAYHRGTHPLRYGVHCKEYFPELASSHNSFNRL